MQKFLAAITAIPRMRMCITPIAAALLGSALLTGPASAAPAVAAPAQQQAAAGRPAGALDLRTLSVLVGPWAVLAGSVLARPVLGPASVLGLARPLVLMAIPL
jgi:hypothetical protein